MEDVVMGIAMAMGQIETKRINMKYIILFAMAALSLTACSPAFKEAIKPNHFGLTPSMEWEVQEGNNVKVKPKIQATMDWNF